ncbi:MAG: class I poly(R)-hydroxyalkanoic acid synthase [Acidocella sp.]|nr:class I poly(R)-hydroxyalkanoic acid synthase [Acidocella sp.]
MSDIAERSGRIVQDFLRRQSSEEMPDPMPIGRAFMDMTMRLLADPARLVTVQLGFWQDYLTLWQTTTRRMMGMPQDPVIRAANGDKRFRDAQWDENEVFDFIKQSYLLSARYVQDVVKKTEGMDTETARKVDFYSRQFIDAMSPSNFLLTNPEVLRRTAETGGENLLRGLSNLLADLERGRGKLHIRMTDDAAFAVGGNIATTPGKVVFQNRLMQLIQYAPCTETVLKRPLLVIPPWINKYYILDLKAKNSFVAWAIAQGHSVFMLSWVNPDEALADVDFSEYMSEGIFAALDAIEAASGERTVNAIGYCLGGTLLASSLAVMAARHDDRIRSATFFVTLLDFAEAGEIKVFIDEEQIEALEARMQKRGYLEGADMAVTFNMLRANDLIWSFVVNNYLLGNDPFPFDLLYWNSDSTRMPAAMHAFYLRNMYRENRLREPGGIMLDGTAVDLAAVKVPAYALAAREDHIAPWRGAFASLRLLAGPKRFVLAASGHIAGVVNPPDSGKYSHWVNTALPESAEEWLAGATEMAGSWWPDWQRWVLKHAKARVPARIPGEGKLPALEDAPGSYVRVRS